MAIRLYPPTNGSGGGKQPMGKGASRCRRGASRRRPIGGDEEEVGVAHSRRTARLAAWTAGAAERLVLRGWLSGL